MSGNSNRFVCLVSLLCATLAVGGCKEEKKDAPPAAGSPAPSASGGKVPTGQPMPSTPQAVIAAFGAAGFKGDVARVRELSTGTEAEQKALDKAVALLAAQKRLLDAAATKFGRSSIVEISFCDIAGELSDSNQHGVIEQGDTALIYRKGYLETWPIRLRKVDGAWKVDLVCLYLFWTPEQLTRGGDALVKSLDNFAASITTGKYATEDDAMPGYKSDFEELPAGPATTDAGRATLPSTRPTRS